MLHCCTIAAYEGTCAQEGIITRLRRYYIDESRLLMKWQYYCGFIVPAGLLFVFTELSLVRYDWPSTTHTDHEKEIGEY